MSTGVYAPIAACMVAGMTPPLGLALATVLFKKRFTKEEREAGKSCWVLGLSYITEGAIPFAVADPIRVIPALMLGSAVAGAISLAMAVGGSTDHISAFDPFFLGTPRLVKYIENSLHGNYILSSRLRIHMCKHSIWNTLRCYDTGY